MPLTPLIAVWLLAACGEDPPTSSTTRPVPRPTSLTGDTGATDTGPSIDVFCDGMSHVMRMVCDVQGAPAGATLRLTQPDEPSFLRGGEVDDSPLRWVGLQARTTYVWAVLQDEDVLLEGEVATGGLPTGAMVDAIVTGSLGVPFVGMVSPCGGEETAVVLTEQGELVWYESMEAHAEGLLDGVAFTEDGTVLGVLGFPSGLVEVTPDGEALWVVVDPPQPMHHDAFRKDGFTYVLVKDAVPDALLDGIDVYDAEKKLVWQWKLSDFLIPEPHPETGQFDSDYSHANSVWVNDEGEIYLSLRHLSTVMKIAGLNADTPGALLWTLVGDPEETRVVGTIALPEESFLQQHNVHLTPDGHLALLDNRRFTVENSRLLWLDVDEEAGMATVAEAWTLPSHCPFQGGAWTTTNGLGLATCAPRQQGYAFAPGVEEPVWTMQASCAGSGGQRFVPRMIPLDVF